MDSSRKFITVSVGAAILLIILVSCTLAYAGRDNTLMSDKTLHLEVNGYSVELPLGDDGGIYDVVSLSSVSTNQIKLLNEVGANVKIDDKGIGAGKTIDLKLERLSETELIEVEVSNEKDSRTLYLRTLSSQVPRMISAGESLYEGDYYGTALDTPGLFQLNTKGEVVFYIAKDPTIAKNEIFWDFKKHTFEDGKVRYSYHHEKTKSDSKELSGYGPGERVILDENYKEIETIALKESENAKENEPIEGHDFIMLSDNHYIVSAYQLKMVNNIPGELNPNPMGSKVTRSLIQEVKDGEVIFEFTSDDHPELYGLSNQDNDYGNSNSQNPDYLHFNSMVIDKKDDNLIISLRNADTIMKIDRKSGEILWKLSGKADEFGLTAEQKTSKQHDVRLTEDGYLTIFDNGVATNQTRIIKLKLDEINKKVLEYKEYSIPGYTAALCGSVQKVGETNEVYTIGWGLNPGRLAALTEVDFETGKKLLEVTMPDNLGTYRIQKFK